MKKHNDGRLGCVLVATGASADTFVRMVSGPSGGSWYPLGAKSASDARRNRALQLLTPLVAVSPILNRC